MNIYRPSKSVLSFKNNIAQFMQGLSANVLQAPRNAFLNVHGRIVATFDQVRADEETLLIVLEDKYVVPLKKHLERYLALSEVALREESYNVYFDCDGNYVSRDGEWLIPQKKGALIITPEEIKPMVSEEDFTLFRLEHGIPAQGIDYTDEMILNVSETDFVSFTKGCFLGQEPVSKVHSRSKPTWRLEVCYEDECDEEQQKKMTSRAKEPSSGRVKGFLFVANR